MEEHLKLQKEYYEMFGQPPEILVMVPLSDPTYMEMLKYCIDHGVKTTNDIVNNFFHNSKRDVVKEHQQANKLFGI